MGRSDLTFTDAPPSEGGAASAKRVSVLSGMYKRHRAACLTCHLASTCPAPATVPGTHPTTPTISPKCLSLFSLPHLRTPPLLGKGQASRPNSSFGTGLQPHCPHFLPPLCRLLSFTNCLCLQTLHYVAPQGFYGGSPFCLQLSRPSLPGEC